MTVTIALAPALGERAGGRSAVHVDAGTVSEALGQLTTRFPDLESLVWSADGGLNPFLAVFLQDQDVRDLGGLNAALRPGDELSLVTAVEGGSAGR